MTHSIRLDTTTHSKTDGRAVGRADLSDNARLAPFDYAFRADGPRTDLVESTASF